MRARDGLGVVVYGQARAALGAVHVCVSEQLLHVPDVDA
jgi:hypothetical protein